MLVNQGIQYRREKLHTGLGLVWPIYADALFDSLPHYLIQADPGVRMLEGNGNRIPLVTRFIAGKS